MENLKDIKIIDTKTGIYHNMKYVVVNNGKIYSNEYTFNKGIELDLKRNKILRPTGIKDISEGKLIFEGDIVNIKIIKSDGKLINVIYNVEVKYNNDILNPYFYILKGNKELKLDDLDNYDFEVTYVGNKFKKSVIL